jgi:hypothetical protein
MIEHSAIGRPGSANRFPKGITDAAETQSTVPFVEIKFQSRKHTCTTVIRLKFVFFKYKLIVYILQVWQVEIGFRDEKR